MIVIAGLPSSGNRLVAAHVTRGAGTESVQVWHGTEGGPVMPKDLNERIVVVIPVRSEHVRKRSVTRRERVDGGNFPVDARAMRRWLVGWMARVGVESYWLSYEGLVADPDGAGRDLFDWLGFEWIPWPTEAAEHPFQGEVFDANAKHVTGPTS